MHALFVLKLVVTELTVTLFFKKNTVINVFSLFLQFLLPEKLVITLLNKMMSSYSFKWFILCNTFYRLATASTE